MSLPNTIGYLLQGISGRVINGTGDYDPHSGRREISLAGIESLGARRIQLHAKDQNGRIIAAPTLEDTVLPAGTAIIHAHVIYANFKGKPHAIEFSIPNYS